MTRKKVPLQFITSDSSRKVTFKKRKKGLMKKVSELSTLCGIEACAIVYGPFSNEPEVWPSPAEARRTIARFRNMSEMDRSKGMVNQQGFLRQRIGKAETHLKKQQRDNHEKEVTQVMYQALTAPPTALIGLTLPDLNELDSSVGKTLHDIEERIRLLKKKPSQQLPHQQPHQPPHQQQPQLGNSDFRPQLGSEGRIRVPEMEEQGGGGGDGYKFERVVLEQQPPPPPPQQWYMDLLKPSDQLYGSGSGLGFGNNTNEDANNSAMMMMMPSSSSSSMAMHQMPNTTNPNGSSSSWPNFLYP